MNITFGFRNCETIVRCACGSHKKVPVQTRTLAKEKESDEKMCTEQVVIYVFRFVTFNRTNSKQHYYYKSENGKKETTHTKHLSIAANTAAAAADIAAANKQAKRTSRSLLNELSIGDDRMYGKSF